MPFCQNCGQQVNAEPTNHKEEPESVEGRHATNLTTGATVKNEVEAPIYKEDGVSSEKAQECINTASTKNEKFRQEFARIDAGQDPKFSVFAFFLGTFQQLYHKSYKTFAKTYLPPILLMLLLLGFSHYATLTINIPFITIAVVINMIGVLWGLVVSILNGKHYTRWLHKQTGGNVDAIPNCPLSVVVGCVVLVLSTLFMSWIGGAAAANAWEKELGNSFCESMALESNSEFSWEADVPETNSSSAIQTFQPTQGVIVPVETPWYGVWINQNGFIKTYEQDLGTFTETLSVLEDGSYELIQYDSRDGSTRGLYNYSPEDSSVLNFYDSNGNYQESYFRPLVQESECLPEELWGVYVPVSGNVYVGPEDGFIVDAYRFGDYIYLNTVQNSEDIYTFCHRRTLEEVPVTIQYKLEAGRITLSMIDETGEVYAKFQKIS